MVRERKMRFFLLAMVFVIIGGALVAMLIATLLKSAGELSDAEGAAVNVLDLLAVFQILNSIVLLYLVNSVFPSSASRAPRT